MIKRKKKCQWLLSESIIPSNPPKDDSTEIQCDRCGHSIWLRDTYLYNETEKRVEEKIKHFNEFMEGITLSIIKIFGYNVMYAEFIQNLKALGKQYNIELNYEEDYYDIADNFEDIKMRFSEKQPITSDDIKYLIDLIGILKM